MAVGALIGAYQEDDLGGLRALLPLAGRSLLEYQARCAAAAGASPIVIVAERMPIALNEAVERLRSEGIAVVPVTAVDEAASRFDAGTLILLIADGLAPSADMVARIADAEEPVVATLGDGEPYQAFERIDADSRWAGVALVEARVLGSTAAMLGDWDLQSTLLRRTIQEGARRIAITPGDGVPVLAATADELAAFGRSLVVASRGARRDWASRFVLPIVEEVATERLVETRVRPEWLIWAALALTVAAAVLFSRGRLGIGLALLVLATPLDLVAVRLAALRLRPLPTKMVAKRLLWPAAGLSLAALGWWLARHGGGWGAMAATLSAAAFAQAYRIERGREEVPARVWLFSRRNAILATVPFALANAWLVGLAALATYAAMSFFIVQHWHHRIATD